MRIISGGQAGVDRAALDVALELGLPCDGWCPAGRWAEDGEIAAHYTLHETPSANPAQRTRWNVRDADATLVLLRGPADGGTALTIRRATEGGRPLLVVDLEDAPHPDAVRAWIAEHGIDSLNVAGPRESKQPGIYEESVSFLRNVLVAWRRPDAAGTIRS